MTILRGPSNEPAERPSDIPMRADVLGMPSDWIGSPGGRVLHKVSEFEDLERYKELGGHGEIVTVCGLKLYAGEPGWWPGQVSSEVLVSPHRAKCKHCLSREEET